MQMWGVPLGAGSQWAQVLPGCITHLEKNIIPKVYAYVNSTWRLRPAVRSGHGDLQCCGCEGLQGKVKERQSLDSPPCDVNQRSWCQACLRHVRNKPTPHTVHILLKILRNTLGGVVHFGMKVTYFSKETRIKRSRMSWEGAGGVGCWPTPGPRAVPSAQQPSCGYVPGLELLGEPSVVR